MSTFQTISQKTLPLSGRVLLALLFVAAGLSKANDFSGTAVYIGSVGLPFTQALTALTILTEIGAGIALVLGFYTRSSALVLAVFTILASVFFHPFWSVPEEQQFITQLLFFKNIAITGGLLLLAAAGPGEWSIDARHHNSPAQT